MEEENADQLNADSPSLEVGAKGVIFEIVVASVAMEEESAVCMEDFSQLY
jgi:hypothetical protein